MPSQTQTLLAQISLFMPIKVAKLQLNYLCKYDLIDCESLDFFLGDTFRVEILQHVVNDVFAPYFSQHHKR